MSSAFRYCTFGKPVLNQTLLWRIIYYHSISENASQKYKVIFKVNNFSYKVLFDHVSSTMQKCNYFIFSRGLTSNCHLKILLLQSMHEIFKNILLRCFFDENLHANFILYVAIIIYIIGQVQGNGKWNFFWWQDVCIFPAVKYLIIIIYTCAIVLLSQINSLAVIED